jgi:hypothetical protein
MPASSPFTRGSTVEGRRDVLSDAVRQPADAAALGDQAPAVAAENDVDAVAPKP